jgi:hypothetical protein
VTVPVIAGSRDQPLDLGLGQVFPVPALDVRPAPRRIVAGYWAVKGLGATSARLDFAIVFQGFGEGTEPNMASLGPVRERRNPHGTRTTAISDFQENASNARQSGISEVGRIYLISGFFARPGDGAGWPSALPFASEFART